MEYIEIKCSRYDAPINIELPAYRQITETLAELGREQVFDYVRDFPRALDHRIFEDGNGLIATDDIAELYPDTPRASALWKYKNHIGALAEWWTAQCMHDVHGRYIDPDAVTNSCDPDICEMLHAAFSSEVSKQTWLEAYAVAHLCKYGEPFAPYAGLAW